MNKLLVGLLLLFCSLAHAADVGAPNTVLTMGASSLRPTFAKVVDANVSTSAGIASGKISFIAPTFQSFLSGSGTYNKSYIFNISSGNATVGATYTNNTVTYTVMATVASATQVWMTGSGSPTASGTLTKASGTGDSALTFSLVNSPVYLRVLAVGGGGGGGGSGNGSGNPGTDGGTTTFGSSLITANGGNHGCWAAACGAGTGGSATIGTGASGIAAKGGSGFAVANANSGLTFWAGGGGGGNCLSSGGTDAGATNTGAGGYGAGSAGTGLTLANGGGAGGCVDATINPVSATYSFSVGAAGSGGAAGTSGIAGAAGGSGAIYVWEFYE